jgi:hypothetical protein
MQNRHSENNDGSIFRCRDHPLVRQARSQTGYGMLSSSFSIYCTNPSKAVQPAAWQYGTASLASMLPRVDQGD